MSQLRPAFEKELKFRLTQKTKASQPEDATLLKNFRYYDLSGYGKVNREQFYQALIKIGVNSFDKSEIFQLFDLYDLDKDGFVNYKEFASILYGNQSAFTRQMSPEKHNAKLPPLDDAQLMKTVELFSDRIFEKGITGLVSLAALFRLGDSHKDGKLDYNTFHKIICDFNIDFVNNQIEDLFFYFDKDGDGLVDYEEILGKLKGKLNVYRKNLVDQTFAKLDRYNQGALEINELKNLFDAPHHPDVIVGIARAADVKAEFYDSIDAYVNYRVIHVSSSSVTCQGITDGRLTLEDFEDYYTFAGFAIDNDQYFGSLLSNVWKEPPRPQTRQANTQRESIKGDPIIDDPHQLRYHVSLLITRFRQRLVPRGPRGFAGLTKQLRIADTDNDGLLSVAEFLGVLKAYKLDITNQDAKLIFAYFDREGKGSIPYGEFMHEVVGILDDYRYGLCDLAWRSLDRENKGKIHIQDYISILANSRNHPDVKSGKKTEEQIAYEYSETIQTIHSMQPDPKNPYVDREEFESFILCLSAAAEDDKYFELVILHTFKIRIETRYQDTVAGQAGGRRDYNPKAGFIYDMHQSIYKGGSTTSNAPYGTSDTHDSVQRPQTAYSESEHSYARFFNHSPPKGSKGEKHKSTTEDPKAVYEASIARGVLSGFRQKLVARGVRGYYGLARHLKNLDIQNTGVLDSKSFFKGLQDFRLELSETDGQKIFELLGVLNNGGIAYEEFLKRTVGTELSEFRENLIVNAFQKLDNKRQGFVNIDDVFSKSHYNAKFHPDVRFGKKNEDDVLVEFLDTFEIHHALTVKKKIKLNDPKARDKRVTLEEFVEYYKIVSSTIVDDKMFEFLITNCWSMSKQVPSPHHQDANRGSGKKHYNFYN